MQTAYSLRCVVSAVFAAPLWLVFGGVQAQTYTCQTKSGHTMSADRPIPECADVPMIERQKSGLIRVIPAPLSAEQRRQQDAEQHRKKLAEFTAREQQRKDNALLASYASVAEIEAARQRAVEDGNKVLSLVNQRIADLKTDRSGVAREAAKYKDQPLPPQLKRQLEQIDTALALEDKNRASGQADIDRINQKYEAEKRRFIELTKPSS